MQKCLQLYTLYCVKNISIVSYKAVFILLLAYTLPCKLIHITKRTKEKLKFTASPGLLRDIQARPLDLLHHRTQDNERLALFPNLDYLGLHQALVALVDVMPLIQSGTQGNSFGGSIVCQKS